MVLTKNTEEEIVEVVRTVPKGTVASYGQIAMLVGLPGRARMIGRVLSQIPTNSDIPWHRVLRASGSIALSGGSNEQQYDRLNAEGIKFQDGRVPMSQYQWIP